MKKRQTGLARQFVTMILLAWLESMLLLAISQTALNHGLRLWFGRTEVQQKVTERQVRQLQEYVTENGISMADAQELTKWSRDKHYILLEVYRGKALVYSSFAPKGGVPQDDTADPGNRIEFYEWSPSYSMTFADGEAEVLLYYNGLNAYYSKGCDILNMLCLLWWFPGIFLHKSRKMIRYIVRLSEEIQAMEGGDLDHPITVTGNDELTTLAGCLDSMRLTLRSQQQQEAEAAAKVKNLITEMSHDLRTPLTTLLLYTEILRQHKYETEEQKNDYLAKLDEKAHQIKQMSDNLFEYALVTRDTVAVLDEPARFSQIFEEPLAEMVGQLQQQGFACALELGEEDPLLQVNNSYIRRILDNISSNIFKYADAQQPVEIRFRPEKDRVGLAFGNHVLRDAAAAESTKVGLTSIGTMMQKMNARSCTEQGADTFWITLWFPVQTP